MLVYNLRIFAFFVLFIYPHPLSAPRFPSFVVWNVGQGQWTTLVAQSECTHFDMGGEKVDWQRVRDTCKAKRNEVYFSHWDLDHISFVKSARKQLPNLCLARLPGGATKSLRKLKAFTNFARCPGADGITAELSHSALNRAKKSNSASRVFVVNKKILIPGDSERAQEREWSLKLRSHIKFLVLGHHGSRTSTSLELLKRAPLLKLGIASARKSRYGHPHRETMDKLKEHGIAVLSTNDWGSIQLSP